MSDLTTYAAMAEIFAATTVMVGALFAVLKFREHRMRRQCHVAAELCRTFTEPSLANALVVLMSLPDGLRLADFQELDSVYPEAAQVVGMAFESMGILVQKDIASLQIVQELAGGLLLMSWRKIEYYLRDTRVEQNNPRFGEWVEWLVDRIQEREADMEPAFLMYAESKKYVKNRPFRLSRALFAARMSG